MHERAVGATCRRVECLTHAYKAELARRSQEAKRALRQRVARRRDDALRALRLEASGEALPLAVLPSLDLPLAPLPAARRRRFLRHLGRAVREWLAAGRARASESPAEPATREASAGPDPLVTAGCATCRGHCCRVAGERAFLDAATLERAGQARPGLGPGGLFRLYASHLPARSIRGSCVYHGEQGCHLPRSLRSDVCNAWLCEGLAGLVATHRGHAERGAFLAATAEGEITRIAVVGRGEATRWPAAPLPPDAHLRKLRPNRPRSAKDS